MRVRINALVALFVLLSCLLIVPFVMGEQTTVLRPSSALADTNVFLNQSTSGSGSTYACCSASLMVDGVDDYTGSNHGAFNTSGPNVLIIQSSPANRQFHVNSVDIGTGEFSGSCSFYSSSILIEGQNDGVNWITIGTASGLTPCALDTITFGSTQNYFKFRFTFTNVTSGGGCNSGSCARVSEVFGWGTLDANTATPTSSPTRTFTSTATPTGTATGTPTRTPTATQTAINVAGNCGGPGQPPCHVYWLTPGPIYWTTPGVITGHVQIDNWPTIAPTITPYQWNAEQTAVAVITAGPGSPPGYSNGADNDYEQDGYHFITTQVRDFGCPINLPVFAITYCFRLTEVTALNMGPWAVPLTPIGIIALLGMFLHFIVKG